MDDFLFLLAFVNESNWHIYAVLLAATAGSVHLFEKIDSIRHRNKQTPPLHDIYQTKEDAVAMEARLNRVIGGLESSIRGLNQTLQNQSISIAGAIGRLEGKTDDK